MNHHPNNPLLPALPLTDGCFFIDNSSIEYLITCARSAEYALIHRRRGAAQSSALFFGGAIHAALEYRYKNTGKVPPSQIQDGQIALLTKIFEESPALMDDHRTCSLATEIIRGYNKKYSIEEFRLMEVETSEAVGDQIYDKFYYETDDCDNRVSKLITRPLVELPFAIELFRLNVPTWLHSSGQVVIIYTGRIDLCVWWDGLYTVDHKTTSIIGEGFFQSESVSPQHEGYMWAIWKTLHSMPSGFVINAISTRKFSASRPCVDKDDFVRQKWPVDPARIVEWEHNIKAIITEFFWKYIRGYLPTEKKWCVHKYGTCQYFDVCSLPLENRQMMLDSGMYRDNVWSPLTDVQKIVETKPITPLLTNQPAVSVLDEIL